MRFITQKNRSILREMVITDFKVRYQGSLLGYAWTVLKPLFLFAVLYVVFVQMLRFGSDIPNYPVYLLLGIVLWGFFSEVTLTSMNAIVGRGDLIKKISIPRYLPIISGSISALINFSINLLVVFIFAFINGVEPNASWLLLPIFVIELYFFALAIGFILGAIYVKYRDVTYIWEVFLQAGFFLTPIIVPLSQYPAAFQKLLFLNPVAQVIQDSRWSLVTHQTVSSWDALRFPFILIPFIVIIISIIIAYYYFRSQAKDFAEYI